MRTPKYMCLDCGLPVYQSFASDGRGNVHADCEIARLTRQRDALLAEARSVVANIQKWNAAVETVIGRQPTTGIELKPLIDAISACEEVKPC